MNSHTVKNSHNITLNINIYASTEDNKLALVDFSDNSVK